MANRVYGYQGYKGYQFETSPKKLQPEYEPNEEQQKKKQKEVKPVTKKTKKTVTKPEVHINKMSKEELKKKAS